MNVFLFNLTIPELITHCFPPFAVVLLVIIMQSGITKRCILDEVALMVVIIRVINAMHAIVLHRVISFIFTVFNLMMATLVAGESGRFILPINMFIHCYMPSHGGIITLWFLRALALGIVTKILSGWILPTLHRLRSINVYHLASYSPVL